MSVPSRKTTVTTLIPNFEIERICSTLGRPLIAPSTGNERSDSTSRGESAGASVITCTCTLVRSGTASIGRFAAAYTPSPATRHVAINTRKRLLSDDSMMAFSMSALRKAWGDARPARIESGHPDVASVFFGLVLQDQLGLELVGPAGDHGLSLLHARL